MSTSLRASASSSELRARTIRNFDWWLLIAACVLIAAGLASLYSQGSPRPESSRFAKQLLLVGIGVVPFGVFLWVHPKFWQRAATALYALNLVLLGAVLVAGRTGGGAQRWIQFGPLEFQPSELSKLLVTLTLAAFFAARIDHIKSFSTFALSFLHILAPLGLIFLQPHLGASLVIVVIWLSISLIAGVPIKFVVGSILLAASLLGLAAVTPGLLKEYQLQRLKAMVSGDEQGNAYQSTRAQIAFGVGGVMGTGFLKGEQKELGFIPAQHTDFIFTVIGEEGGLIGSSLVLAAFGFFFYRAWLIMFKSLDPFYKMVSAGIIGALAFHMVVNIGMNLQLLPVVGLWLPFLSYGGTAMWLCLACVGLLLNIRIREKPLLF